MNNIDETLEPFLSRYDVLEKNRVNLVPKLRKFLNGHVIFRIIEENEQTRNRIFWEFANNGGCDGEMSLDGRFLTNRNKLEDYFVNKVSNQIIDENDSYYSFLGENDEENEIKTLEEYENTDNQVREVIKKNKIVDKFLDSIDNEAESYIKQEPEYFLCSLSKDF